MREEGKEDIQIPEKDISLSSQVQLTPGGIFPLDTIQDRLCLKGGLCVSLAWVIRKGIFSLFAELPW